MKTRVQTKADSQRACQWLAWAASLAHDTSLHDSTAPPKPSKEDIRAVTCAQFREHTDHLMLGKFPEPALDALHAGGFLEIWLPEVASMVGFGDGEWRHKDVWKHTKQVVKQSVRRLELRWGALLHDIGKPKTRRIEDNGQVTFYGHAEVGAAMFRKRTAQRLGMQGALYERVHFLILHHLRPSQYRASWTDSAVRRFYKQMGPGLRDLLDLSRADITTKRPERRKWGVAQISALQERIRVLKEQDAKVTPLPKGLGHLLMNRFGLPPSRLLGDIRKQLEEDVATGRILAGGQEEYYADWVAADPVRFGLVGEEAAE
ncbi:MAG: HDIG domain-containing metalloprotein [Myxococcota bacterium]